MTEFECYVAVTPFMGADPVHLSMHILVAIDQSEESYNALENALDIVSTFEGRVTAVHVDDDSDEDSDCLSRSESRAQTHDVPFDTELLQGEPVSQIATFAEERDVDAIYVGHRGLTSEGSELHGESRGPLGSVAKGLVERTRIPVTVFDRGL